MSHTHMPGTDVTVIMKRNGESCQIMSIMAPFPWAQSMEKIHLSYYHISRGRSTHSGGKESDFYFRCLRKTSLDSEVI